MKVAIWILDVWGNEKDGFEVNDRSRFSVANVGEDFFEAEDWEILAFLKDEGFLKNTVKLSQITIDGDGESNITVDEKKSGRPLCTITTD